MTDAVLEAMYDVITKSGSFYDTALGSRFYLRNDAPDKLKFPYMTYTAIDAVPVTYVMPRAGGTRRTSWSCARIQFNIYADKHADDVTERDVHILGRRLKDVLHDAVLRHPDFENGYSEWNSTVPHAEEDVYVLTVDYLGYGHERPWT